MSDSARTRRQFVRRSLTLPLVAASPRSLAASRGNRVTRYRIERIELYMRETQPDRMTFVIGKRAAPATPRTNPIAHVRMIVSDASGREAFGCSGDRLSVRWLDKRPHRPSHQKLQALVDLLYGARDVYLADPAFDSPFDKWLTSVSRIQQAGRAAGQEALTASFASALMERAMVDAVCRLAGRPLFRMVREDGLGWRPERVHPELRGRRLADWLPARPVTRFHIRHSVGLADPLTDADLPADRRVNDGLPETLAEYVETDGLTHFKVKVSGDVRHDLARLLRVWQILPKGPQVLVTLDANEAFASLPAFAAFVERLRLEHAALFERIAYIEQPLPRSSTLDPTTGPTIRRLSAIKPLIIDEADGTIGAFARARAIGYRGVSHKNCKGFFKSLLNRALIDHHNATGDELLLSGEDLSTLPIVPLHQDFAALGVLGLTHCERNGHHYSYGLSLLSPKEKKQVAARHADLYERRGDEWFLRIRDGVVDCASLQCTGFGVCDEPEWRSMADLRTWMQRRSNG